jgi:hypothetical protein
MTFANNLININLINIYSRKAEQETNNLIAHHIISNTDIHNLIQVKQIVNNYIEPVILNNNMPVSPPKLKRQENITVSYAKYIISN